MVKYGQFYLYIFFGFHILVLKSNLCLLLILIVDVFFYLKPKSENF